MFAGFVDIYVLGFFLRVFSPGLTELVQTKIFLCAFVFVLEMIQPMYI